MAGARSLPSRQQRLSGSRRSRAASLEAVCCQSEAVRAHLEAPRPRVIPLFDPRKPIPSSRTWLLPGRRPHRRSRAAACLGRRDRSHAEDFRLRKSEHGEDPPLDRREDGGTLQLGREDQASVFCVRKCCPRRSSASRRSPDGNSFRAGVRDLRSWYVPDRLPVSDGIARNSGAPWSP